MPTLQNAPVAPSAAVHAAPNAEHECLLLRGSSTQHANTAAVLRRMEEYGFHAVVSRLDAKALCLLLLLLDSVAATATCELLNTVACRLERIRQASHLSRVVGLSSRWSLNS